MNREPKLHPLIIALRGTTFENIYYMQDTVLSNMTCQVVYITGQWLLGLVGEMVSSKEKSFIEKL